MRDPIPIDTTDDSPMAELAVILLALFAHMERVFMRERAAHAREVAAEGKQPGRPRKLDANQLAAARAALAAQQPVDQVAAAFGISRATLYRNLATGLGPEPFYHAFLLPGGLMRILASIVQVLRCSTDGITVRCAT